MADAVLNVRLRRLIGERGWTQAQTAERVNQEYERITGRQGLYTEESIRMLERGNDLARCGLPAGPPHSVQCGQ
jgi:hypothetical protein